MPSVTLDRPFSFFFRTSQLAATASAVAATVSPKTCGCRATNFSCTPRATSAKREPALLAGQHGVEVDLEEQIPEFLFQMGHRLGGHLGFARGHRLDGVERLVGLLQQVPGQRPVRLLLVPRALGPQPVDELVQPGQLDGHRRRQPWRSRRR